MAFSNYLTSMRLHLLKHIRGVFTLNDTSALTEAEVKAFVKKFTSESAVPIPTETFSWLSNYFRYVGDKDNMFVYDNTDGLWHFETTDASLQNLLTDYFTVISEEATKANSQIFFRYANHFFGVGKIPNLSKRIRQSKLLHVRKSTELIQKVENLRYFKIHGTEQRALLDMMEHTLAIRKVSFKDTQPMQLQHISPIPISLEPDPNPTLFLSLIETYMMQDPELIAYFHKVLAYMMAPYNYNQVYVYFIGEQGRNGKSTIIKVMQDILGPHSIRMNAELLNAHPASSFKKDDALAATEGRSLLIFNEIDERMQASTQNIKDLTEGGRDEFGNKIMTVVRPAYSKNFEVNICGTPVVMANSLLNFGDWSTLDPIFQRLILIPFDFHITKEDPTILNRLAAEYPTIQAWLYKNYFKHKGINLKNIPRPAVVSRKFVQYREDSDIIGMFFSDCVTFTGRVKDEMKRGDLYRMYQVYCKANGRKSIKNKGTNGFSNLIGPYIAKMNPVLRNGSHYVQMVKETPYFADEIKNL